MESTTLKSKLFVKNEKSAARRTSTPESVTQRAATQRASGPGGDADSTADLMSGGGPSGGGGAGGDRRDTKIDIPLPQYMTPAVEKFADKRVKVSSSALAYDAETPRHMLKIVQEVAGIAMGDAHESGRCESHRWLSARYQISRTERKS
ncbi:Dvir\GJ14796-PA-like protein [Anopheles sinensis]|uniref:Dvir\GJ14796-PA-like protein n=1 Tax=Anopheles sinensis TaxID=74873 RepID=A0A084VM89_ANOSI|nr:Dvir\GJ14796-PA-like protein [Anopheles sinensis]